MFLVRPILRCCGEPLVFIIIVSLLSLSPFNFRDTFDVDNTMAYSNLQNAAMNNLIFPDPVEGFECVENFYNSDYNANVLRFIHKKTKSEHIHVIRKDENNSFMLAVPTESISDRGEPHVLEHLTLSLSKNFRVSDPFFSMTSRTFSIDMNAYTCPIHVAYHYSSFNTEDFFSLMNMYLNSVFQPVLNELTFARDAWRFQNIDPNDPESPVNVTGVVYNEMLGYYSHQSSYVDLNMSRILFKDSHFKYSYGGYPKEILNLTLKDVINYYNRFFVINKIKTLSYGSIDCEKILSTINNHYEKLLALEESENTESNLDKNAVLINNPVKGINDKNIYTVENKEPPNLPLVSKLNDEQNPNYVFDFASGKNHKYYEITVPDDPTIEKDTYTLIFNFPIGSLKDEFKNMGLHRVALNVMTDGFHTPLYEGIIKTELADGFHNSTDVDGSSYGVLSTIGFKGIKKENVDKVYNKTMEIFKEYSSSKIFEEDDIKISAHRYKIGLKRRDPSLGSDILRHAAEYYLQDIPLEVVLDNKTTLSIIESLINDRTILTKYFLKNYVNNKDLSVFVVISDPNYRQEEAKKRSDLSKDKYSKLSAEEKKESYELSHEALKLGGANIDRSLLPIVKRDAIAENARLYNFISVDKVQDSTDSDLFLPKKNVKQRITDINGLSYVYIRFDITGFIDDTNLEYLGIYTRLLGSICLENLSLAKLGWEHNLYIADFDISPIVYAEKDDQSVYNLSVLLSFGMLNENIEPAINHIVKLLYETKWDEVDEQITALKNHLSNEYSKLNSCGDQMASNTSSGHLGIPANVIHNRISGINLIKNISNSIKNHKKDPSSYKKVINSLKKIANTINYESNINIYVISDTNETLKTVKETLSDSLSTKFDVKKLDRAPNMVPAKLSDESLVFGNTYLAIPIDSAFLSYSIPGVTYTHKDSITMRVIAKHISINYLHNQIREIVGAYGSNFRVSALNGPLSMTSYRTPIDKINDVIKIFHNAIPWFLENADSITDDAFDEAILSVYKTLDMILAPQEQGVGEFSAGLTYEDFNNRRSYLKTLTKKDVVDCAKKYLVNPAKTSISVIGPNDNATEIIASTGLTFKYDEFEHLKSIEEEDE